MQQLLSTSIGRLRVLAFLEGVSFLLILFVTMPLKYLMEIPEPNQVIGMAHGVLFIAYVVMVLLAAKIYKWPMATTFWSLAASIIPFGTFWADKKYFKPTEVSGDVS